MSIRITQSAHHWVFSDERESFEIFIHVAINGELKYSESNEQYVEKWIRPLSACKENIHEWADRKVSDLSNMFNALNHDVDMEYHETEHDCRKGK